MNTPLPLGYRHRLYTACASLQRKVCAYRHIWAALSSADFMFVG
jgi:hypothetical protein